MPIIVTMPQLGESLREATISRWLKQEGESIAEYEPLFVVETDKVTTEIPSPASGSILKIYVPAGAQAPGGAPLALIGQPEEIAASSGPASPLLDPPDLPLKPEPQAARGPETGHLAEAPGNGKGKSAQYARDLITPAVSMLAAAASIRLQDIAGSGKGGRVTKKDVLRFIERGASTSAGGQTSAYMTSVIEADMSAVLNDQLVQKVDFAERGVRLTITPYIVVAAAYALSKHAALNASCEQGQLRLHEAINIGLALSGQGQAPLIAVIKRADEKSLFGIARAIGDLVQRARNQQLRNDHISEGTFTIVNHGATGALFSVPIPHQSQCAVLSVGAIEQRARVMEGLLTIRPLVYLSLSFHQGIVDATRADTFLATIKAALEGWG